MFSKNLKRYIRRSVKTLQHYAERWWYPPLLGFLAAIDSFVLVVPNDGILVSSTMLTPKRWVVLAVFMTVGSTIGGICLTALVELRGLPWILEVYPNINKTQAWNLTAQFFESYGLLFAFAVAATPLVQQPALILAGLANTPLIELTIVVLIGRLIKFLLIAYLGSHAPRVLGKLWGLEDDLSDAGVDLKTPPKVNRLN